MNRQKFLISEEVESKITDLMNKMTLEEKIGQLNQAGPSLVGGFDVPFGIALGMMLDGKMSKEEFEEKMSNAKEEFREDEVRAGRIGSFLGASGAEKINRIQKIAVEESRLGIPLIMGYDTIHGQRTVFPIPLAESCTWDKKLFKESGRIAATEAAANGIHWVFAPMIDIARDARWGRIAESPGEDTYLASVYAKAKIEGFQGEDLSASDSVIACPKHFVAYGGAQGGRDYNTVDISYQTLHEVYLPPFKTAVEAGAGSIMPAFNDIGGVPCTVNKYLLDDVLRKEYGFKGFTVSDANAIAECVNHGVAADKSEAAEKALKAGIDMDMNSNSYIENLELLLQKESISMDQIDESVRRILRLKYAKGLFDNPYISNENIEKETILRKEYVDKAREIAKKSIVLLKNNGVLPINKESKIALVGELANNAGEMLGTWSLDGKEEDCVTILEGLKAVSKNVKFEKCCSVEGEVDVIKAKEVTNDADVIIAVVGELKTMSGEAASRSDITLPGKQEELLKILVETGKPVIAVLINGRPLAIPWVAENVHAVVEAWQLGIQAGNAIADVLFGDYNPSGKLTTTFPATTGQCPAYYNHPTTGRPGGNFKFTSRYLDAPLEPVYCFGHGLSYTTYEYSNLRIENLNDKIKVSVNIKNTGDMAGEETVQLYIRDIVASRIRPIKELKAFEKVWLEAGESKEVILNVKINELGFYDEKLNYIVENGEFKLWVGSNSKEGLEGSFTI